MLAYVADDTQPNGMRRTEVSEPAVVSPAEMLIRVHATALNRGELVNVSSRANGTVLGWDFAGVVERPTADGSGPPSGTPVYGWSITGGSWAEYVVAPSASVVASPDGLAMDRAAAIGVAGVTALYAVRRAGSVLGRRVIVTGAAGGVGRMAVQLAAMSGATVEAIVGDDQSRVEAVTGLGLDRVRVRHELEPSGSRAHLIIESVGGDSLSAAFRRVAQGGCIVTLGRSSREPGVVPPHWFYRDARLEGLEFLLDASRDRTDPSALAILGELVADGRLDPGVGAECRSDELPDAAAAVLERRVPGRAVIRFRDEDRA